MGAFCQQSRKGALPSPPHGGIGPPASAVRAAAARPLFLGRTTIVEVQVRDNNVDQALRALKKKMQREGLYRELRMRRHYEKPSERRAREKAEAVRRFRKLMRKRAERDEL